LDGKIKSFELYEPFKQLYEEGRKLWQEANVSTCELSDDPWFVLYKLAKPFFFTAFQVELATM